MTGWTVEFLDHAVAAELDAWPIDLRAALTRIIERINSVGLERMGDPHVRHIEGKLWEMRPSGRRLEGAPSTSRLLDVGSSLCSRF